MKARILSGSFSPVRVRRRTNIDARCAGNAQGLGDIAGIEPAGKHERNSRIEPLSSVQSNGVPSPPGRVASLRRARVEDQPVGDVL